MENTLQLKLTWDKKDYATYIPIDPKDLSKFVDDCLNGFDMALRQIISFHRYGKDFSEELSEEQRVEIDNIIEGLK